MFPRFKQMGRWIGVLSALLSLAGCKDTFQPLDPAKCLEQMPIESTQNSDLPGAQALEALRNDQGEAVLPLLDQKIRSRLCKEGIPGMALGIIWQGKLAYLKGFGWARDYPDAGASSVVARATRFRWASVSKTVTGLLSSIASHELKSDGTKLFDLDLPIQYNYAGCNSEGKECEFTLPTSYYADWNGETSTQQQAWPKKALLLDSNDSRQQLTARMLLANRAGVMHYSEHDPSHSSGIPTATQMRANPGFVWAVNLISGNPLLFAPRADYHYSSFGFNMAGAALDVATRDQGGYWGYAQSRVVQKASMPMQFFHPDDTDDSTYEKAPWFTWRNRATGYAKVGKTLLPIPVVNIRWKLPGGGFISSVTDLAIYAEGLMNYRFLSEEFSKQMWTPQKALVEGAGETPQQGYALGYEVDTQYGEKRISHNGLQEGGSSRIVIYPYSQNNPKSGKLGIVLMSNGQELNVTGMADAIEEMLRAAQ